MLTVILWAQAAAVSFYHTESAVSIISEVQSHRFLGLLGFEILCSFKPSPARSFLGLLNSHY